MTTTAPFWATQLIVAVALNAVVSAIQIGAYAARYAGATTGRIGTSISLFNLFMTASRLATLLVTPSLGALADSVAGPAVRAHMLAVPPADVQRLDLQMRVVALSATAGTILGALLLPVFVSVFTRGIRSFERRGSVLRAVARLADPRVLVAVARSARAPSSAHAFGWLRAGIPAKLIVGNTFVYAIYTIGVLAAYYASVLNLDARATATGLSGIVNGLGTIAFTLFVDPTSALMVDQSVKGERSLASIRAMVLALTVTAIAGTALSQLLLVPGAWAIAGAASIFRHGVPGLGGH